MWEWRCRWEPWQQVALFFSPPSSSANSPLCAVLQHCWVLRAVELTPCMDPSRPPGENKHFSDVSWQDTCTSLHLSIPVLSRPWSTPAVCSRVSITLIPLLWSACFPPPCRAHPMELTTLLAAHLCLPRLWVWCCLAQLLGYPLLFLSIYSLWALPPGSLDVDVLLLTKKKGKRNQTCTVFTKGNTYLRYFDCIDLALECGDLFKCTLCTMELKLHCTACWLLVVLC